LSTITKLSPGRLVGLMMGVWFLSTSLGDYIAGRTLQFFKENAEGALFSSVRHRRPDHFRRRCLAFPACAPDPQNDCKG